MDSIQLKRILESDFVTKRAFEGVYASDQLKQIPKPLTLPATYVINEDLSTRPGTHWIALFLDNDGTADYFDSYGLPPIKPIVHFIKRISQRQSIPNKIQLQSFKSQTCGPFCIFYLIKRHEGFTLEKMINAFFTTNPSKLLMNDYLVRDYVCHRYQIHLSVLTS